MANKLNRNLRILYIATIALLLIYLVFHSYRYIRTFPSMIKQIPAVLR